VLSRLHFPRSPFVLFYLICRHDCFFLEFTLLVLAALRLDQFAIRPIRLPITAYVRTEFNVVNTHSRSCGRSNSFLHPSTTQVRKVPIILGRGEGGARVGATATFAAAINSWVTFSISLTLPILHTAAYLIARKPLGCRYMRSAYVVTSYLSARKQRSWSIELIPISNPCYFNDQRHYVTFFNFHQLQMHPKIRI